MMFIVSQSWQRYIQKTVRAVKNRLSGAEVRCLGAQLGSQRFDQRLISPSLQQPYPTTQRPLGLATAREVLRAQRALATERSSCERSELFSRQGALASIASSRD